MQQLINEAYFLVCPMGKCFPRRMLHSASVDAHWMAWGRAGVMVCFFVKNNLLQTVIACFPGISLNNFKYFIENPVETCFYPPANTLYN